MSTTVCDEVLSATARLGELMDAVNSVGTNGSDSELIDQITILERIKSACAASQARLTHEFVLSQTADGAARKIRPDGTRRSITAQIGLARRDSRFRGQQHVGVAHALVADMPETLSAMSRGDLTEYRARVIITELACLTPGDRARADGMIAAELPELGDRSAETRAAAIAYRLDPEAVMGKVRGAVKDRHISLRPAPDTMSRLSALLPVAHGVAIYAALSKSADSTVATGDGRTRSQIMADELVSRVTGQAVTGCDAYGAPTYGQTETSSGDFNADQADRGTPDSAQKATALNTGRVGNAASDSECVAAAESTSDCARRSIGQDSSSEAGSASSGAARTIPVTNRRGDSHPAGARRTSGLQLNLIMTDRTLFGCDDEPAQLIGHGPIPAALARSLVRGQADDETKAWVRRLYTGPTGGQLVAMDSQQRLFPAAAVKFLIARDQTCRTPWCDAPIRHIDHVTPHSRGGPTHIGNGQGLCEACNLSKQAPGWQSRAGEGGVISTTTPTGHTYSSSPPALPTSSPWPPVSAFEKRLAHWALNAA